ncbi:hypothetical protein Tco_0612391 [Tanacetum coccineum]
MVKGSSTIACNGKKILHIVAIKFLKILNTMTRMGDALRKYFLEGPYTPSNCLQCPINKNVDNSSRYKNDNLTGQFRNQMTVTVAGSRETISSQETKRVKDYTYHKEKMLLCKQAEKGVSLQAKQADWLEECDDERVVLANLISNLKLDIDENKKIQKQLKKANASLTHELKECKSILAETSRTLKESNSTRDSCLIALQKNLALIAKYFKKIYKPTNNNLITSLNSRNKNVDNSSRYKNDNLTGQVLENKYDSDWAWSRETISSQETKRVKDYTYHKEKMLLCKQAEKGVSLQAKQADWLEDMDQEVPIADSGSDTEPLEQVDSNVIPNSPDMCNDDIKTDQNAEECDNERVALANLIANLKLDIDENKKIQK